MSPTSSPPPADERPAYYRIPDAECKSCGQPFDACDLAQSLDGLKFNVIKYAARAGLKPGEPALKDWMKCLSYVKKAVERELRRENGFNKA